MSQRVDAINQHLNHLRDLWRAELSRVEGVLNVRMTHLEDITRNRSESMDDRERAILRLMYDLHVEQQRFQTQQIEGIKRMVIGVREAVEGAAAAIESVERSQDLLVKLMKATGDLMVVN
jgi:hypothetical protein